MYLLKHSYLPGRGDIRNYFSVFFCLLSRWLEEKSAIIMGVHLRYADTRDIQVKNFFLIDVDTFDLKFLVIEVLFRIFGVNRVDILCYQ